MGKVAIIGSGLIGQGWSAVFAQAGFDVAMYDPSEDALSRAERAMETRIADLAEYDLIEHSEASEILARISIEPSLEAALDGADYVQENAPERVEVKQAVTAQIDAIAPPDVPIGSSTSGISASRYCADITGRHRCLVVHPINPPHLIPAVEIVPTEWTDPDIVTRVTTLMQQSARETIVLNAEIDGFVVNRLQGALLEEAFKLVGQGIVSGTDLDKAISHGLGLRWSFMGPMQTIHLNAPGGVVDYVARYGEMYRGFELDRVPRADWSAVAADVLQGELETRIPVGQVKAAQDERDRKLMALMRHKRHSES